MQVLEEDAINAYYVDMKIYGGYAYWGVELGPATDLTSRFV